MMVPAPHRDTNFLQAWARRQALSSGGRDSDRGCGAGNPDRWLTTEPGEGSGTKPAVRGPVPPKSPAWTRSPVDDLKGPTHSSPSLQGWPAIGFTTHVTSCGVPKIQNPLCYVTVLSTFRETPTNA